LLPSPGASALTHFIYQTIPKTGSKIWFSGLWASQNAGRDGERSVEETQPADG